MDLVCTALEQIFAHAAACAPRESCGLLIAVGKKQVYVPCINTASHSEDFRISAEAFADAEERGEVLAVVHSHPGTSPTPTMADRVSCERLGLPWLIVGMQNSVHWLTPEGYQAPLLGRPFVHGVLDCYALVKDWYAQERALVLPEIDRCDGWWDNGQNLYVDNFEQQGFITLSDEEEMQAGDCFLMQVRSPVPNHAAIYLGDGIILHHLYGRLSARTVYGGYWQTVTTHKLRHKSCVK